MPNYDNNHVKGDLYITFDVEFPRGGLSDSEKEGRLWFVLRNNLMFNSFTLVMPIRKQFEENNYVHWLAKNDVSITW